jgi:hypothetical protein
MHKTAVLPVLVLLLATTARAAMPLTADTCRTLKTEPMRQQCMRSAVDAPPSVTGKTYSTLDVQPRGPVAIEIVPPALPVTPYLNVTPPMAPARGVR